MTRFETWLLKRLLKREVRQSSYHTKNIQNLYTLIRKAVTDEFTEDNIPTTDNFLREIFERTQHEVPPTPTEFLWVIKNVTKNCTDVERSSAGVLLTMLSRTPYKVEPNEHYY